MASTPWEDDFVARLRLPNEPKGAEFATYLGQNFITVEAGAVPDLLRRLRDEEQFDYLVDVTAVDWPKREQRFDLVYILYSHARNQRVRVKTRIADGDKPASAVPLYVTANWLEREVYDMFGIEFAGHSDLRRILMPDDWRGWPLRKDYGILQMDNQWVAENLGIESGQ